MSQFFNAEKILIVDHATLHQIAQKLDRLQGNCILINNTGRCGSTLICQVFFEEFLILKFVIRPLIHEKISLSTKVTLPFLGFKGFHHPWN